MAESSITQRIPPLLDRLRKGDETARDELINLTYANFRSLAQKVLHAGFKRLKRWEETDDIVQEAALRLWESLKAVRPESVREYLGLGAVQVRRELTDLCRHYFGRGGDRLPDRSPTHAGGELGPADLVGGGDTWDPAVLALWTDFHRLVGELPDEEREVMDLLVYQGLTQEEASEVLGVDPSTVKRRWRRGRRKLARALGEGGDEKKDDEPGT